ncbi:MAG TPA: hypothetical protein VG297_11395 [Bryobacteraceae bacterium]|nr:hypothetical protein [Bryobacteraceae bacterium]
MCQRTEPRPFVTQRAGSASGNLVNSLVTGKEGAGERADDCCRRM